MGCPALEAEDASIMATDALCADYEGSDAAPALPEGGSCTVLVSPCSPRLSGLLRRKGVRGGGGSEQGALGLKSP